MCTQAEKKIIKEIYSHCVCSVLESNWFGTLLKTCLLPWEQRWWMKWFWDNSEQMTFGWIIELFKYKRKRGLWDTALMNKIRRKLTTKFQGKVLIKLFVCHWFMSNFKLYNVACLWKQPGELFCFDFVSDANVKTWTRKQG